MSAQPKTAYFRRFPRLPDDKARELAKALDFEAKAGEALMRGPDVDGLNGDEMNDTLTNPLHELLGPVQDKLVGQDGLPLPCSTNAVMRRVTYAALGIGFILGLVNGATLAVIWLN